MQRPKRGRFEDRTNREGGNDAVFFESAAGFRAWLEQNHESPGELWVGFYKQSSGRASLTYQEALAEALCFGWIDGVRHPIDGERYRQRFTRRRPGSRWSARNVELAEALIASGRMRPPGLAAFEARAAGDAYGRPRDGLSEAYESRLRQHPAAWAFFQAQPAWYRRTAGSWVMDAKQESTRERRFEQLAADCAAGTWIKPLRRPQPDNSGGSRN